MARASDSKSDRWGFESLQACLRENRSGFPARLTDSAVFSSAKEFWRIRQAGCSLTRTRRYLVLLTRRTASVLNNTLNLFLRNRLVSLKLLLITEIKLLDYGD